MERFRRGLATKSGFYLKFKRLTPSSHDDLRTVRLLQHFNITHVLDVGANTGQFAESLYDFGYKGKVISFEPLKSAHAQLMKRASKYSNWEVAEQCAIGDANGEIEINITDSSVFSSILKIKDSFVTSTPKSKIIGTEKVKVFALDTVYAKYIKSESANVLLKIDTQGYEYQVVQGAIGSLKKLKGIKIEMPLFPIYDNVVWTFYDILKFMHEHDFIVHGIQPEGVNLKTGRMRTCDGIFFKE